jgi:capsular exopolysaccharide synthesis family protein
MNAQLTYKDGANENVISQMVGRYLPYWPVFLLLTALAVTAEWFFLKSQLPVYECSATVLIKDQKKGVENAKVTETLDQLSTSTIADNEVEVLKSRSLINKAVRELRLYAPVYQKAKWTDVPAYLTSPIRVEAQNPDSLVEVAKIDFTYDSSNKRINLYNHYYPLNQWLQTEWGILKFSSTSIPSQSNASFYFSLLSPKRVTEGILKRLKVIAAAKTSSVINLKLKDQVPRRGEDILNAILDAYEKASVGDKNRLAENTLAFLDERLRYVSSDLNSIEKKMQQYRSRKASFDISSQGRLFLQNVSDNDQKVSDVNMKLAVLNQVEKSLAADETHGRVVPSTLGIDDPMLSGLINRLYDAELSYEQLKRTTGANNPILSSLQDQIEKIKPSIYDNIRSQRSSLEASKRNLYSTNNTYTSLLRDLPQQEKDLVEITREQNIKSSIYNFLLQKREETALSLSSTVADSRIVDKAESSLKPIGLGNTIVYVITILLAMGFGIVLITARELFNPTVLFRQQIEALTSFPVIGEIVYEKAISPIVVKDGQSSFISEEFRMLRTSLHYLGIGAKSKKILVTSTIAGEGKSFVAANLAITLALSGKRVVLVEFDLSNPTLAIKLGIDARFGLADYLSGAVAIDEVIRTTEQSPNLSVITAGNLPHNPSELILQDSTETLLQHLQSKYDYIIVDSAPVGLLSDGYVLSKLCDATLYIVRHGYTPKKMLERLEQNNKINQLKNLAIVFNGVRARGFASVGEGYGYGIPYKYNNGQKKRNLTDTKLLQMKN